MYHYLCILGYLGVNNKDIPWYNYEFILAIGIALLVII